MVLVAPSLSCSPPLLIHCILQVVGLTNRPELLDEALLRPGRLEVHLKVQLPDARGRAQILNIHSRHMRANGALSPDALALLEPPLGVQEEDVRSASSFFKKMRLQCREIEKKRTRFTVNVFFLPLCTNVGCLRVT